MKKVGRQFLLQNFDLVRHGGLSHMELLRCPRKTEILSYGQKASQLKCIHDKSPSAANRGTAAFLFTTKN